MRAEIRPAAAPVGRYTRDFVCREKRIVIEVDGGQHAEAKQDAVPDRYLREQGYRVLRYWNNDVLSNLQGVLESIASELGWIALSRAAVLLREACTPSPGLLRNPTSPRKRGRGSVRALST